MLKNLQESYHKNKEYYEIFAQNSSLPKPPNDVEKYIYKNGSFELYAFIAILVSLIAAIGQMRWIFDSKDRWPFLISVFIFAMFSVLTYAGAFIGKKFSHVEHDKLIKEYAINAQHLNKIDSIVDSKENFPSIDIYLPSCGEELEVLENTFHWVTKLEWYGVVKVFVLDDKDSPDVKALSDRFGLNYINRKNRGELKKAGNLRNAFTQTDGDYFVIFDADFCPRHDFLLETIPYMEKDKKIGLMQTPQYFHITEDSNFIELGSTAKEELFYRCIQPCRDSFNAAMCVGTNAIYRREAVEKFGGVAPIGHSEDIATGFKVISDGWSIKYIPIVLAKGTAPSTVNTYFSQQYRWALGTFMQLFDKDFWFAKIPFTIKLNYITSIFYYLNVSTGIIMSVLPVIITVMFYANDISPKEFLIFLPFFLFTFVFHPLWQKTPWNLKCASTNLIAHTSYLFALFDTITGSTMDWVPTGQAPKKSDKMNRYYEFMWFLGLWHLISYSLILYFAIMNMNSWDDFRMYPVIMTVCFYGVIAVGVFEPKKKFTEFYDWLMLVTGLRIIMRQLKSILTVIVFLLSFSVVTVLAANKEGRAFLVNKVASISVTKNNSNSIVPIPYFTEKTPVPEVKSKVEDVPIYVPLPVYTPPKRIETPKVVEVAPTAPIVPKVETISPNTLPTTNPTPITPSITPSTGTVTLKPTVVTPPVVVTPIKIIPTTPLVAPTTIKRN
jgi:cellulose synthase/poly-beta-1,6-N-acetylglucosamine synthase-like glycosyltransferase